MRFDNFQTAHLYSEVYGIFKKKRVRNLIFTELDVKRTRKDVTGHARLFIPEERRSGSSGCKSFCGLNWTNSDAEYDTGLYREVRNSTMVVSLMSVVS